MGIGNLFSKVLNVTAVSSLAFVALNSVACSDDSKKSANQQNKQVLELDLSTAEGLKSKEVDITPAVYDGRKAVKITVKDSHKGLDEGGCDNCTYAYLPDFEFHNGTIEVELAGMPTDLENPGGNRGFVGVVFRVHDDLNKAEGIYLRPVNSQSEDQIQKNRSVQYFSAPDYPWHVLREEFGNRYETFADVKPGEWANFKIVVKDNNAELYVNNSKKPTLKVEGLFHGKDAKGTIGFFTEPNNTTYFRNLKITKED